MLTTSQLQLDDSRSKAILNMRKVEKQKRMWNRINKVCGKIKRGVCTVHVPAVVDGETKWELISEKEEMERVIREQNVSHLSACENTPFGKGEFFEQIHDKKL